MFLKSVIFVLCFLTSSIISQITDSASVFQSINEGDSIGFYETDSLTSEIDSLLAAKTEISPDTSLPLIDTTSNGISDSLTSIMPDTTIYFSQKPFSSQSRFITKSDIQTNDYRYTGNLFKVFPFSFERSYGFIGQPNDIYLYAENSISTNYFVDGIPVPNSFIYSIDFNQLQSEDIDSLEVVSMPRGFLYGFLINPVSVNVISKDINPAKPYSRVKYYEGPFGEAFIDGIFSLNLFRHFSATLDITNRKVDPSFKNSAFSIWQIKSKLKYHISNNLNLIGNYYFSKSETGINGGVNFDEIEQTVQSVNALMFDETLAPVNFEDNSLGFKQHNFGLKVLAKPFEIAYTDLNFYYKFYQLEYNAVDTVANSKSTNKNKVLGVNLDQRFALNPFYLSVTAGYQALKHNPSFTTSDSLGSGYLLNSSPQDVNAYFVSPLLSINLFDSSFIPSFYYKQANINRKNTFTEDETKQNYTGFGADLSIYFGNLVNLYFGYSLFDQEYLNDKVKTLEVKFTLINGYDKLTLGMFNKKTPHVNLWGGGLDLSYMIWNFLLEGRVSQYFVEEGSIIKFINIPETKINAGLYYRDLLFNSNLDLKAGFVLNYTGKQNLRNFLVPYVGILDADIESWLTLDFTLSAEIQKLAIVYFTWENLFDWNYYITPYYPMLERNVRFGIAWEIFN